MIFEDSRYALQPIVRVTAADGVTRPTIFPDGGPTDPPFRNYIVVEGDRFDTLAFKFLNDPELWWHIADANPEVFYPDDLIPGSTVRIPAD